MKRQREQVRLNNLEILIAEAGSATKVAQLAGTSESYLSQVRRKMLTQSGTPRGLGNELAAKLEKGLGKPEGWMDEPHEVVYKTADTHRRVRTGSRTAYAGEQTVAVELSGQERPFNVDESADTDPKKTPSSKARAKNVADVVTLCPSDFMGSGLRNGSSKAFRAANRGEYPALPRPLQSGNVHPARQRGQHGTPFLQRGPYLRGSRGRG